MKKYINIPYEINFNQFTLNQSILFLYTLFDEMDKKDIIKILYHKHPNRFENDLFIIKEYSDRIKEIRRIQNFRGKIKKGDTKNIPLYYKMKIETFNKIINDKTITKAELLIILFILKKYMITFNRIYTFKIKDLLNEIFICENTRKYKKSLYKTLNKLMTWKYEDNSVFIKKYEINEKEIAIKLDNKNKK